MRVQKLLKAIGKMQVSTLETQISFKACRDPNLLRGVFHRHSQMFKLSLHVLFSSHHCTLHTYLLHTAHYTLHTAHRTIQTAHCRLNIAYWALNAPNCTQQSIYTAYYVVSIDQFACLDQRTLPVLLHYVMLCLRCMFCYVTLYFSCYVFVA